MVKTMRARTPILSVSMFFALCVGVFGARAPHAGAMLLYQLPSQPSNILFIPGTEGSRLYYRNPIGLGVAIERQVWEPDYHTDIPYLVMNADGTSRYPLYTKENDIIGSLYGNNAIESQIAKQRLGEGGVQVYGDFKDFMNNLVASGTIKEWRAYPYDWRYDVRDVVNDGTFTEMPDHSIKRVYVEDVLEQLASSSPTGQVTIIAHSNGGLVAKALLQKLEAEGKSGLVDRLIMIGTPQWGTPAAIGALLHADNFSDVPNLIVNSTEERAITKTMPGPYDLLPSPTYLTHVADPVATFDQDGLLSGKFAISFGGAIWSFLPFENFLEDSDGLDAQAGGVADLHAPVPLSPRLIDKAVATHAALDNWIPPHGVWVTTIVGWGQDTVKTLAYTTGSKIICSPVPPSSVGLISDACADTLELEHTPVTTQDGDGTVVSASAVGDTFDTLYFNAARFWNDGNSNYTHQNLTAAAPIQNIITDILSYMDPSDEPYITADKPTNGANPVKLRISSHSPVNLVVTDASGNQSGVLPIPGTDFSGVKQDIPGSSVQVFDDEQYVNIPQNGTYTILASGYAPGAATIRLDTIGSGGVASTTATFADIPTTASSTITFSVSNDTPTAPAVDLDGDGTTDFIALDTADPLAYVRFMRDAIKAMALPKSEHFALDARLSLIERQLTDESKRDHGRGNVGQRGGGYRHDFGAVDSSVKLELDLLARYVENQFALEEHASTRWHNAQIGIPTAEAETILGMINRLTSLL